MVSNLARRIGLPRPAGLLLLFGLLATLLCVSPAALAQPADGAPAGERAFEDVRARMERAQALFVQKRYEEALAEFEAGYAEHGFGAFLYNAAVAAEKARDRQRAIARYREFLAATPDAPDAAEIRATIDRLERELTTPEPDAEPAAATREEMRSLLLIESQPSGAPVSIYERVVATAAAFNPDAPGNPGWRKVASELRTPADESLRVGVYHVVIEPFQDYNRSDTRISLDPGTVFKFRANLSQGEFLGSLEITSQVRGALVFVDDPPPHKLAPFGETPITKTVAPGDRRIWVEAPGFELFTQTVTVEQGKTTKVHAELERVGHGYLVIDAEDVEEARVEVDGESVGLYRRSKGPLKVRLPAGERRVEIDADGRKTFEGTVSVPGGQEQPIRARLEETPSKGHAVATTLFAAGCIGGGIGLREYGRTRDDEANRETFTTVGTGVIVAGGVLGALSIFFWIYDPSDPSTIKRAPAREFTGHEAILPSDEAERQKRKQEGGAQTERFIRLSPSSDSAGLSLSGTF